MSTIATTTNTTPFVYEYSVIDRASDGRLYCMVKSSTADRYDLYYSTNNGSSWSSLITLSRANVVEIGPIYTLQPYYNELVWVYRTNESNEDRVWIRSISNLADPSWAAEILVAARPNGGVAGAWYSGMDVAIWVKPSVTVWAVVAIGNNYNSTMGVSIHTLNGVSLAGLVTNYGVNGNAMWMVAGTGRCTPSLELEHNGDGKSTSTPNIWVAFGRAYLGIAKLAWGGNGWIGSPSFTTVRADLGSDDAIPARWDGQRFICAFPSPVDNTTVMVEERNRANTSTVERSTPTHPTGVVKNCTLSYNSVTGDIRVFAVGTSTTVLYYVDYVRATGVWSSWASVLATALLGTNGDNYAVRRGSYGNARIDVATAHSGSPNTLTHTSQVLTYAPYTPTWNLTGAPYTNGGAADVAATLPLTWVFSDADPGDTQGSYALSRQIGAGTVYYWRASDTSWQTTETQNSSGTSSVTLASSWGNNSDANHVYKAKVWNAGGQASSYSAALTLVPSAKVDPTITAPTASQVLTTGSVTFTWTASQETAYRVTLTTNPGGVLSFDSGWITGSALTYTPSYVLANGSGWTGSVQTRNNEGLGSTVKTVNFTVSYTVPATPTLVCTPSTTNGYVAVAITNPVPGGGQPVVSSQELWRRVGSDDTTAIRIAVGLASGATYNDWRAAAATAYQYRSHVFGVNGTAAYSAWTA